MPSENYRYYCLDATGNLHQAEWFYADNDEGAVALIEAKHPNSKCEIWHGQRLLATVGSDHKTETLANSYFTIDRSLEVLRETARMVDQWQEPGRTAAS